MREAYQDQEVYQEDSQQDELGLLESSDSEDSVTSSSNSSQSLLSSPRSENLEEQRFRRKQEVRGFFTKLRTCFISLAAFKQAELACRSISSP
jgi:hypothetical protein